MFLNFKIIEKHISLIYMLFGAGALFLVNFILYGLVSDSLYIFNNMLILVVSISFSLGLLGFEQVLIRVSYVDVKLLAFPKALRKYLIIFLLFGSLFISIILSLTFFGWDNFIYIFFLSLLSSLNMLFYNLLRLGSCFRSSQLVSVFWKVSLTYILLYEFYFGGFTEEGLKLFYIISLLISFVLSFSLFKKSKITVTYLNKKVDFKKLTFAFFISTVVLTLFTNVDKLLLPKFFDEKEVAAYFYLVNIFLSTSLIFANYIGFKSLVDFKKYFNYESFKINFVLLFKISLLLSFFIFLLVNLFIYFYPHGYYNINLSGQSNIIFLLLIMAVIRVLYSYVSSALGAVGDFVNILKANAWSLLALFTTIVLFFDITLFNFISIVLFIWLIRLSLYFSAVKGSI
ncbi:hypothetical protein PULV_a3885 [Pseudoalteromonas ulvae UL12]|uniref:hypothetical protein n=1 Tax=Pseudoalteromonas ulvae TaxID=107327 RepID=UPI00186BAB35|nr:hypothetical protein [Pseudoalteromonas ulvae]MBE0363258.1 hypothetical protein [Pseudoalteromonas ulvae UL12]